MQENIHRTQLLLTLRWVCYVLLLVLCYMLQSADPLMKLGNIRPLWLPAAALVVACCEDALPGTLYAMFAGLLWDLSANRLAGFFAIGLMVTCFICCCAVQLLLRRTVFNVSILCLVSVFLITGLDYLFTYALFSLPQRQMYFFGTLLPTVIYTMVVSCPLYGICLHIRRLARNE